MSDSQDFKKNLRDMAAASSRHTDEILEEELRTLLSASRQQLEVLRPHITDNEAYDRLIAAVEEATRAGEQTEQLKEKLIQGGSSVFNIGKVAANLLSVL